MVGLMEEVVSGKGVKRERKKIRKRRVLVYVWYVRGGVKDGVGERVIGKRGLKGIRKGCVWMKEEKGEYGEKGLEIMNK